MLELIIENRTECCLEHNILLNPLKLKFRKGKGTIERLIYVVSQAQIGFTQNKYTVGIFLHISAVYTEENINYTNYTIK